MPQDFMLSFLLERKCAAAVTDVFARIRRLLRGAYGDRADEMFMRLFPVILTDNGTEFTLKKAVGLSRIRARRPTAFF